MNPLGALIGGVSSLLGGFMNTTSQQAINAANLQQETWAAQGGYLPGLVANAQRAGLSPLAVLGQHAPTMGTMVSGDPGRGVAAAGQAFAQIKDPHQVTMERLAEELGQSNILKTQTETAQTAIEARFRKYVLDRLGADNTLGVDLRPDWGSRIGEMFGAAATGLKDALPAVPGSVSSTWESIKRSLWDPQTMMR